MTIIVFSYGINRKPGGWQKEMETIQREQANMYCLKIMYDHEGVSGILTSSKLNLAPFDDRFNA